MPLFMYDAAYAPSLAAAKARGAVAMSHYMTRSYAGTSPQPAATLNLGMGVNHNWEGMANELVGASRAKGLAVGREALAALPKSTRRDGTVSIKYSVDVDLSNLSACDQAFRGLNDAHKGSGVMVACYAEGGLIERLHGMGLVQGRQWLSMSEGFGGFAHALASGLVGIVQMHDASGNWIGTDLGSTDRNTIISPRDSGIEWPAGSPYLNHPLPVPAPTPVPVVVEDQMILVSVDTATVPTGTAHPGVFTFDAGVLSHVEAPTGKVNNLANLEKKLGAPVHISYSQYKKWGGK